MTSIAEKYAQQWMPNGEVSLADLIQAAVDEAQSMPVAGKHPSHTTRSSDASSFDEVCINCGAKDISGAGWGDLAKPCSKSVPVVGEPVAGAIVLEEGEWPQFTGTPLLFDLPVGDYSLIIQPTNSIPAAELATLREKAAMVDELRGKLEISECGMAAALAEGDRIMSDWQEQIRKTCAALKQRNDAEKERDELRKDAPNAEIGAAIQRAAKELPDGCDICINIGNGSATVELYLAGTDASFDMDVDADNRLAAEIHTAIDAAIAQGKGGVIMGMIVGNKYNWKYQSDRLVYLGKSGAWHQFAKVGTPTYVWCEVLDKDLHMLEATQERQP